jgi:hypothetical protein
MRNLITSDVFAFARLIKASGVRGELTATIEKLSELKDADLRRVGIDTVLMIIEALAEKNSEKTMYEALAPVLEIKPDEVAAMPPADFFGALKQISEENDLANFFASLSGILGKI